MWRHGARKNGDTLGLFRSASASQSCRSQYCSHGKICWQAHRPRSQWGCDYSNAVQFGSCGSGLHAASRRSSGPAPHEARTLLGVGAGSSRIRFPGKPIRAVPPKTLSPLRHLLDHVEVLTKPASVLDWLRSACSLEEKFGAESGTVSTEAEFIEDLIGGGSDGEGLHWRAAHSSHLTRVHWNYHCEAREEGAQGSDDSSQGVLQPAATSAPPLRALRNFSKGHRDGRRIGGFERQHAMLCQICGILEYAAKENVWPDARPVVHWSPTEVLAVVAWHRAKKQPTGEGPLQAKRENLSDDDHDDNLQQQTRAAMKQVMQVKQQGGKGAKAKDVEAKIETGSRSS